jgi:RNA polymerase sigma-70 factor
MPKDSTLASPRQFLTHYQPLLDALHVQAQGARWGLSRESFAEGLRRSAEKRFAGAPADPGVMEAYLKSLHLDDLALACACGEGIEAAWEFFVAHFREDLRRAAAAMLRSAGRSGDAHAEELADSLHAELYGVRSGAAGRRKSLFEYFHGRSKLSTWLRAVLAQKLVDLLRISGRTVSLDEQADSESPAEISDRASRVQTAPDPHREKYIARFQQAFSASLAALAARERMILACYYVDQMTLAEIGRLVREHESTVSRQLERLRRELRERVTEFLRRGLSANDGGLAEAPLDDAQIELAFEYALEDWPFDLAQTLSKTEAAAEPPDE